MTRTLYAGRLWFEATETELQDWFGQNGPVETVAIGEDPQTYATTYAMAEKGGTPGRGSAGRWRMRSGPRGYTGLK